MNSLYILREYGISKKFIAELEKYISISQIRGKNFIYSLTKVPNKISKIKLDKIRSIYVKNPKLFDSDSLYELEQFDLTDTIIEKMISDNISIDKLMILNIQDFKSSYKYTEKTIEKIYKSLNHFIEFQNDYYRKIILKIVKRKTIYKYMSTEELQEALNTELPKKKYNDLLKNISILEKEKCIIVKENTIRFRFPTLEEKIASLSEREKNIVYKRLKGITYIEIGSEINLTRERVRQIFKTALKKITINDKDIFIKDFNKNKYTLESFKQLYNEKDETFYYLFNITDN